MASSCKFKKIYFPSVEEYLKFTESYDKFITDDTKKSHSVKQDDTYSPCYYLSILDKKKMKAILKKLEYLRMFLDSKVLSK